MKLEVFFKTTLMHWTFRFVCDGPEESVPSCFRHGLIYHITYKLFLIILNLLLIVSDQKSLIILRL
jgi:hypothetical protein